MGVEVLLLFGLGLMGVVLTNLLSADATTIEAPVGDRSRPLSDGPGGPGAVDGAVEVDPEQAADTTDRQDPGASTDGGIAAAVAASAVASSAVRSAPQRTGAEAAGEEADGLRGVGIDAPDARPRIWGTPAPLARLIALVAVGAIALCSTLWGAGWLAVRAVERMFAGG